MLKTLCRKMEKSCHRLMQRQMTHPLKTLRRLTEDTPDETEDGLLAKPQWKGSVPEF